MTPYVQAEKAAGRNTLAFVVKNSVGLVFLGGPAPDPAYVPTLFNSREAVSNRPQLVIGSTAAHSALFVVGAIPLGTGDAAIQTRLQNLGYTVTSVVSNAALNASSADGQSLVVISSTVTPTDVANKFLHTPVPVLNWRADLMDDLGMTGVAATEYGVTTAQTQLNITNNSHPLAAGLATGLATVVTAYPFGSWA